MSKNAEKGCIDEHYYCWRREVHDDDGNLRRLNIGDPMTDEVDISDLLFDSPEQAAEAIRSEAWGYGEEEAAEFVLLEVTTRKIDNPFSRG